MPKDVIIELFWPDFSSRRASNNLSIAIHQIRASLRELVPAGSRGVCVQQGLYGLDRGLAWWVDVHEFQRHVSQARKALQRQNTDLARQELAAAVDLYRGDFLESDPYEEWATEPRRFYGADYSRSLAWLAADAAERSDWSRVLDYAGRIVRRDPCDEQGHRWLMTTHWQLGNRVQALLQYRTCSERLMEEMGVQPSEETQKLLLMVKDGQ